MLGSAVGSGSDVVARVLAHRLSENIGQPVVVDNRAGAAGLIGAEIVARATPDGYTIFIATLTQHLSTTLQNQYRLEQEFEPEYASPGWYGAFAPLNTPKHIVARLHKEFARTIDTPDMRERLLKVGVEPAMSTPQEFGDLLANESKRMAKVLSEAGVQAK